jgi:hypothetical protein
MDDIVVFRPRPRFGSSSRRARREQEVALEFITKGVPVGSAPPALWLFVLGMVYPPDLAPRRIDESMTRQPDPVKQPYRIPCGAVWGGIQPVSLATCTKGVNAALYSNASGGGRGGDIYYMSACSNDLRSNSSRQTFPLACSSRSDTTRERFGSKRGIVSFFILMGYRKR